MAQMLQQHEEACARERQLDGSHSKRLYHVRKCLNDDERKLSEKLDALRRKEVDHIMQKSSGFHPAQLSILTLRDMFAPSSALWKAFHQVKR